jgi:hypothetical protein
VRWLTFDADLAWSRARFTNGAVADPAASDAAGEALPAGTSIPGSVETVASAGVTIDNARRFSGSLRLRYFGPRPLVEDNSIRSSATTLMNAQVGYQWSRRVRLSIDALNLMNASDSDIDYYYASRLPGEPLAGVDDIHFHPTLPRTFRITLAVTP